VDNRCGTTSSMGTRAGEQLHYGWIHPYFACARNYCDCDQCHPGTKTWINDLQALICRNFTLNKKLKSKLAPHNSRDSTL
jgi:hypothetical protein